MSTPERSPKRQRTSYSPASPPLLETKPFVESQTLHTPPPSVHMSPSWQTQNSSINGGNSATFPTPPSTAGFLSQMLGRGSDGGEESGGVTPTDNIVPAKKDVEGVEGDVEMVDEEHRRTDHERSEGAEGGAPSALPAPPLYKFSAQPIIPHKPHPSQDLIGLYSLRQIQATVARRDPITGEKINKLRKSYESKAKNLGVEGRNKATVQEGHLQGLVDPLWDSLVSEGVTMWDQRMESVSIGGAGTDELTAGLSRALGLKPGRLPKAEHVEWTQQLGLDETAVGPRASSFSTVKPANSSLLSKTAPTIAAKASVPSSPSSLSARPDRAGKKRRYDESSYEGYDDDGDSVGGLDESGRKVGTLKRVKRKDFHAASSPPFTAPGGSSHSMVGVRGS